MVWVFEQVNGVNEVQEDFSLSAVDIVADPSALTIFRVLWKAKSAWENAFHVRRIESQKHIERTEITIRAKLHALQFPLKSKQR